MPESTVSVCRFGSFTLDLAQGTLRRGAEPVFLRPKAYTILAHLAENTGRVVPKSELMDAAWPGIFVTEDSLTQSIREIRKTLGENMIRTVSKRGYMLAVGSEELPDLSRQPIVAVLRFRNDSGNPSDDALVDGFAEDIIYGLARFGTFTVLARNSSFSFTSYLSPEWQQIRARIGADYVVEGSVNRYGDRIVAAVSLADASNGSQLWGERYVTEGTDLFLAESDIVEAIVGRLVARVDNAGLQQAIRKPVTSLAAYELVLRGLALLRDPAQSNLEGAETLFLAALAKDPNYGLGLAYLALSRIVIAEFGRASPAVLAEAHDLVERAVALAPDQSPCRRVQSLVRLYMREHEAAERHLRIGLTLNPYDADSIEQMGYVLTMRGRPVDALGWLDRAIRIDPLQPHWCQYDRSLALYLIGEYRPAAEALEMATRPAPWISTRLAACYAQLGRTEDARQQLARARECDPNFSPLDYARTGIPFEHRGDAEHLADGVMLALGST